MDAMTISLQLITNAIIIVALVVWVGYRQTTWRAVDPARMWRMPLILGVIGILSLGGLPSLKSLSGAGLSGGKALTGIDIAVLLVELVVSLGLGAIMGAISTFRPMTREAADLYRRRNASDRRPNVDVSLEARTGWLGMVLWIVLIAVRVGMDLLAARMGSTLADSTGVILIMVAANRCARVAVILYRSSRRAAATVGADPRLSVRN
jgi:hypothetical protein